MKGSLSKVGIPSPHNSNILQNPVASNTQTHISQLKFTHLNISRLYVTMISILYKMGGNNEVVLHITVFVAIFMLFCDDKNTDSE